MKVIRTICPEIHKFADEDSVFLAWKRAERELPDGTQLDDLDNCMLENGWEYNALMQMKTAYPDKISLVAAIDSAIKWAADLAAIEGSDANETDPAADEVGPLKAFLYDYYGVNYDKLKSTPTHTITQSCPCCGHDVTMKWDISTMGLRAFCPMCGNPIVLDNISSIPPVLEEQVMVRTPVGAIIVRPDIEVCKKGIQVDFRRSDEEPDTPLAQIAFFSKSTDFLEYDQGTLQVKIHGDVETVAEFEWEDDHFKGIKSKGHNE